MKLADFFSNYFTVRAEMVRAVQTLSQDQLDWTAPNHPASIGRLLAHIADCEYYWIGHVAAGKTDRPDFGEFKRVRTLQDILASLHKYEQVVTDYMVAQDSDDWDEVFYTAVRGDGSVEKVSKRWTIWQIVEHQARHRGQIFMLMRMQGIEVPVV